MKKLRKIAAIQIAALTLVLIPSTGNCDFWGGDIPLLIQIVTNTMQQLVQLKEIVGTGSDTLGLLRDVNRGINDSLGIISTIYPNINPGIYKNWGQLDQALRGLTEIYGAVTPSQDARVKRPKPVIPRVW